VARSSGLNRSLTSRASDHVERIHAKIDASNRAAAAMFAVRHGLLPEERTRFGRERSAGAA
jgi:hypothetical protein